MKHWLLAYISFTRIERLGWLFLLMALLIALASRLLPATGNASSNDASMQRLNATWHQFHTAQTHTGIKPVDSNFVLDINLADSASLLVLRGIGPHLAHRIVARRRQLGPYHNYSELWAVYPFSSAVKRELKQHTLIDPGTLNRNMY